MAAGKPLTVDASGQTPLHREVLNGKLDAVRACLGWSDVDPNQLDSGGRTALHIAVLRGNVSVVETLALSPRVNVNIARPLDGATALHLAVHQKSGVSMVKALLIGGANVCAKNNEGKTPAECTAAGSECRNILEITEQLFGALEKGDVAKIEELLKRGAVINVRNQDGRTLLHLAVIKDDLIMISFLLNQKIVKNTKDREGKTALHLAVEGDVRIAQMLLARGADLHISDSMQRTGLHSAAAKGNYPMVKLLIGSGANVCVQDKEGRKPSQYAPEESDCKKMLTAIERFFQAVEGCNVEEAERLLEEGVPANARKVKGWTGLHLAAAVNDQPMVRLLIQREQEGTVNVFIKNQEGKTPSEVAPVRSYSKGILERRDAMAQALLNLILASRRQAKAPGGKNLSAEVWGLVANSMGINTGIEDACAVRYPGSQVGREG